MPGVGNGQLNEYWGFSGLEIDADIPTSTGCPGSNLQCWFVCEVAG